MSYVFLLHFDRPYAHARHYLEFTSRRIEDRVNDHRSGFAYRTTPLMLALHKAGIGFTVARVWANATKRDEKALRDLRNNPRICPICNPSLRLTTKQITRTSEAHDYTGEIFTYTYWRTSGNRAAYGNLAAIRERPLRPARPRIRRDGTPSGVVNNNPNKRGGGAMAFVGAEQSIITSAEQTIIINGRPYDIDVIAEATNDIAAAAYDRDDEIPF